MFRWGEGWLLTAYSGSMHKRVRLLRALPAGHFTVATDPAPNLLPSPSSLCMALAIGIFALQPGAFEDLFKKACFNSYLVTLRIKNENTNDEQRMEHIIRRMTPVDAVPECHALPDIIHKYG